MTNIASLKKYVSTYYPLLTELITDAQYEQISWIDLTHQTNESALASAQEISELSFTQKRVIDSLYFLFLLNQVDDTAYESFVHGQSAPVLENSAFIELSSWIKSLSPTQYNQLWVASLTIKSAEAETRATEALGEELPFDAVQFLSRVMSTAPECYPAAAELIATDETAREGFACMFDTGHFRHMMYVEGGSSMFTRLQEKIEAGLMNLETLNHWICYWLINIASFRSHTPQLGSAYLTQHTFEAIACLRNHLIEFIDDTSKPILRDYLNDRADWLELAPISPRLLAQESIPRLILARIAAMQRLFTPEEGAGLQESLSTLKELVTNDEYSQMIAILNPLRETHIPTPTYSPSLLANLKTKVGNYEQAIVLGLPIYAKVISTYQNLFDEGKISVPLNLNGLSSPDNLEKIINGIPIDFSIDPSTGITTVMERDLHAQLTQ